MIWSIFIISLGLASARKAEYVEPEHLEALRASGQHQEFARLLGVDVSLVLPNDNEERSEFPFTTVSEWGDILMTEEQERSHIDFSRNPSYRWPSGIIPYVITQSDFSQDTINRIHAAARQFNGMVSKAKINNRTRQSDYVQVIKGSGCWSYIGRIGGQQSLSIGNGCESAGTIIHEFMHAFGVHHEQNRHDRDNYVIVNWDNIPQNWHSQYQKVDNNFKDINKYDYRSVMHYPYWAPETYKDAFTILDNTVSKYELGQRDGMTKEDADKINVHYS